MQAGRLAKLVAVFAAVVVAILGFVLIEDALRYSIVLYVVVVVVSAYWGTTVLTAWLRFRREGVEMQSLLVPEMVPRADVSDLCKLAATRVVVIGPSVLRASESEGAVSVEVGELNPNQSPVHKYFTGPY